MYIMLCIDMHISVFLLAKMLKMAIALQLKVHSTSYDNLAKYFL